MTADKQILVNPESLSQSMIKMAVESWRFGKVFDRMLMKLDVGEQSLYKSQFSWLKK